jgi:hypothetical protein
LQEDNEKCYLLSSHGIDIDVVEKKLAYPDEKKIPKDELTFAEFFLSKLDDSDFQFLYGSYFIYKNDITEGT